MLKIRKSIVVLVAFVLLTAQQCSITGDPKTWPSVYGSCSQFNSCQTTR